MIGPSFAETRALGEGYAYVPVYGRLFSDQLTPMAALKKLRQASDTVFLFESVESCGRWSRYSFLGLDPSTEITCKSHELTITGQAARRTDNPLGDIREVLKAYSSPALAELPSFTGGLVGYFSYEFARYAEPRLDAKLLKKEETVASPFKDVDLLLFTKVIAFDHYKQQAYIIVQCPVDGGESAYNEAVAEVQRIVDILCHGEAAQLPAGKLGAPFAMELTKEEFEAGVRTLQEHIGAGDIFQAVFSNKRYAPFTGSLYNAYRVLRTQNPSPYMFYLSSPQLEVTGASPETLVRLRGRQLETFPIAGTVPRGATEAEDQAYEAQLLADEKERAEHDMLVDLGRNDLGKISEFGSVKVAKLHEVQRFSHVIHLTSTVQSTIAEGYDALDAIQATLPAGTLSGAPKLRAMELLSDLEPSFRGLYGGAIGYIDLAGNMDVCIGIRMAVAKDGEVTVQTGAGIVKDSVPEKEFMETVNKAKSMIEAIERAQFIDDDYMDR